MPLYTYVCQCGRIEDQYRKIAHRDEAPECHGKMSRKIMPAMIISEIREYKTVAVDKETGKQVHIGSRRQHREFLKRNDYVEVGNDSIRKPKRDDGPANAPVFDADEMKKRGWTEDVL